MVQNPKNYKYDVAISFLSDDKQLATEINDLIKGRLTTYIYTEKSEPDGNSDGEKLLNEIFGSQALIVVVLYRQGWGETGWTQIEQTAIRNRAFDEGYDFTIFIPLDPNLPIPRFVPKTQFWYGLDRWRIDGVAAVIEKKVQELGGTLHEESVLDKARRLEQESNIKKNREQFLNSNIGVKQAQEEIELLLIELKSLVEQITNQLKNNPPKIIRDKQPFLLTCNGITFQLLWRCSYSNTLNNSSLELKIHKGIPEGYGYISLNGVSELEEKKFNFDLSSSGGKGWREEYTERFFSTRQLADHCMIFFIDQISGTV